jgi:hypothetical protein
MGKVKGMVGLRKWNYVDRCERERGKRRRREKREAKSIRQSFPGDLSSQY